MHRASPGGLRLIGRGLLGLALCLPAGPALATGADEAGIADPVRRLIITTANGAAPAASAITDELGVDVTGVTALGGGSYAVDVAEPVSPADAALLSAASRADPAVARPAVVAAIPDRVVLPADLEAIPLANDPRVGEQWALWDASAPAGGHSIRVGQAWRTTPGDPDVVVAVIDTGITGHPDLDSQIVAGRDFISDPFTAGDGDGVDADPTDEGDFTGFGFPGCPMSWSSWHGTHVAGAVAARMDGTGVVGVAPGVSVSPVRILGRCGGSLADLIAAIRWAAGEAVAGASNPNPAQVISMSLSGTGSCPNVLAQAVQYARSRGVAVIAAAGNAGGDASMEFPANCPGVHAVTATGRAGQLASYANTGSAVAIAAPGGSDGARILSTSNSGDTVAVAPSYRAMQGTSMATPLVSAAVALVLSAEPALTGEQAWARVAGNARQFPQATGRDCIPARCGVGLLDLVGLLPDPPGLSVAGQVTRGGLVTSGVSVALLPTSGEPGYYGRTEDDGSYRIAGLPAGQYRVRFTHGPTTAVDPGLLWLTADTTGVDHSWPALGSITGTVVAAGSRSPLPGVDVGLAGPNGPELFRHTTTDTSGGFTFPALHAGGYRIQVGGNTEAAAATWLGGTGYEDATVIPVTDGNDAIGVQVVVSPKPAVLSAATSAPPAPAPEAPPAEPAAATPTVTPAPATPPQPAPLLRATAGRRKLPGKPRVRLTPTTLVTLTAAVPAGTTGSVQFADSAGPLGEAPIIGVSAVLRTRLRGGAQVVVARVIAGVPGPDSNPVRLRVVDRRAPRLEVKWVARSQGTVRFKATDAGGVAGLAVRWRAKGEWSPWHFLPGGTTQWSATTWSRGSCLQLRATDWAGHQTREQRCW